MEGKRIMKGGAAGRRLAAVLAVLLAALAALPWTPAASAQARHKASAPRYAASYLTDEYTSSSGETVTRDKESIVIEFTGGVGGSLDGLAKTRTYFDNEAKKYPMSIMIDTGGSSLGLPYPLTYDTAPYLKLTGSAQYDVCALDPAAFSQGEDAAASMIRGASLSGWTVPYLATANISPSSGLSDALDTYGVEPYARIEKYRKSFAVFTVLDESAMPSGADVELKNAATFAGDTVSQIEDDGGADLVICVAHFGAGKDAVSKAKKLAENVPGIDVILLAGQDDTVQESAGDTVIAGCAGSSSTVGRILFTDSSSGPAFSSFEVDSVPADTEENAATSALIRSFEDEADDALFGRYGLGYRDTLTTNAKALASVKKSASAAEGTGLTDFVTDAYASTARKGAGVSDQILITAVSTDALSGTLGEGTLTTADAVSLFSSKDVEGAKVGPDLVDFYLSGRDVTKLAEQAGGLAESGAARRLTFSGLVYSYNTHRRSGKKAFDVQVVNASGNASDIDPDALYHIVADETTAGVIRDMAASKDSALSFTLKDADGKDLKTPGTLSLGGENGLTLSAWYAAAQALASYGESGVPASYQKSAGRVRYETDLSLSSVLKEASPALYVLIAAVVIAIVLFILWIIFRDKIREAKMRYRRTHRARKKTARDPFAYKTNRSRRRKHGGMFSRK